MGVELGTKENRKLRDRLCHSSSGHASCLPYPRSPEAMPPVVLVGRQFPAAINPAAS